MVDDAERDPRGADNANPDPRAVDDADLVHETRKAIKRMRALARLLREQLGEDEFARVNRALRSAARRLAVARDAEVRLATLAALGARHPQALAHPGAQRLCAALEREREQPGESPPVEAVLEDIADMRELLTRWNLTGPDLKELAPGLERIYREGRQRRKRLLAEPRLAAKRSHDWRKRVKALYYALDMLGGLRAKGARRATKQADRLGDVLGEEHDLLVLNEHIAHHAELFGEDRAAHEELIELIERRRQRLHRRALKLGGKLYRRKPKAFARHITRALSR